MAKLAFNAMAQAFKALAQESSHWDQESQDPLSVLNPISYHNHVPAAWEVAKSSIFLILIQERYVPHAMDRERSDRKKTASFYSQDLDIIIVSSTDLGCEHALLRAARDCTVQPARRSVSSISAWLASTRDRDRITVILSENSGDRPRIQ